MRTLLSSLALMIMATGCDLIAPSPADYDLEPTRPLAPLSPIQPQALSERIERVLVQQSGRQLSSSDNAAWQIFHGVICYGHQLQLVTPDRGTLSALDYLFQGGQVRGWHIMPGLPLPDGRRGVQARLEPGSYIGQGHVDQWIGYCALAELPASDTLLLEGQSYTLQDWARQAQLDVAANPLNEYSWSLMALTYYFPDQPHWTAADGSEWSWERMVEQEVRYDINSSPCGGTHRLVGLARALAGKDRLKLPDSPVWSEARHIVQRALNDVQEMRSHDGSLSSHYLERAGSSRDLGATLSSAGHLLEFVANAADERLIAADWVEQAAVRLCEVLEATSSIELDCGGLYHALNGLKQYKQRRFAHE